MQSVGFPNHSAIAEASGPDEALESGSTNPPRPNARLGLSRSRSACVGRTSPARPPRSDRCDRPHHHLHDLRNGSPYPERRRPLGDRGPRPWSRGRGCGDRGRTRCVDFSSRRPSPHLVHYFVRPMRFLPEADVLALSPRRVDPWEHDRRHTGGSRPYPATRIRVSTASRQTQTKRRSSCSATSCRPVSNVAC